MSDYEIPVFHGTIDQMKDANLLEFDVTWMQGMENYRQSMPVIPIEHIQDKTITDVMYHYNSDGFRCDEFGTGHRHPHILYAGCSQTEGVGGNIEDTWSYMLHQKIGNGSPFFSIARAGYGWQKIISNTIVYIKKYGAPDYVFCLLPNLMRYWKYFTADEQWGYVQDNPGTVLGVEEQEKYRKAMIDFIAAWNVFDYFLKTMNVQLIWSTWDTEDTKNFDKLVTTLGYFGMPWDDLPNFIYENSTGKADDIVKRDGHEGRVVNQFWAEQFMQKINNRGGL